MDLERLSSQLVRALRGKRSQAAVGRRLGYSSNVVYAWESGRRAPVASDLFRLGLRSVEHLAETLPAFCAAPAGLSPHTFERAEGVALLLSALARGRSIQELARLLRKDRSTVARWLRGTTQPKLPELLGYVAAVSSRLLEFVALFVDPGTLPATRRAYGDLLEQRRLAYDLPASHAVLRALELTNYRALPKHVAGYIARSVGISLEEEERYLEALVAARQVQRKAGRYVPSRVLTVDTRLREADNRRVKQHWAELATARFASGLTPEDTLFSYNLFAIDREGFERIRRLHLEYYERVREVVAAARDSERVVLLNMQLVPLELPGT